MRRPKRVLQLFFGFLVILLFSTLVAPSASAATPVSDPGANIDHAALRHAAYNIKISNGRITIIPNGAPLAYPRGCGLTVSAFREANFIDGDAFTGCNSTVASIQQDV